MNFIILIHIISWYLLIFITGNIFWITFHRFFIKLNDSGYAISKVLSLVIISLTLWTLGFVIHLPINVITIAISFIIFYAILIFLKFKFKIPNPKFIRKEILITEAVFLISLIGALIIASVNPQMDNITERMMDFNFLNTLTNSDFLPAKDVWFVGKNINYYYFGYFFWSNFNKITFTDSYLGYLLSLGYVYSLATTVIFSLGYSLKKKLIIGIFAVTLLFLCSNYGFLANIMDTYLVKMTTVSPFRFWVLFIDFSVIISSIFSLIFIRRKNTRIILIALIPLALGHLYLTDSFSFIVKVINFVFYNHFSDIYVSYTWYWDISRVIQNTINEFPFFSLLIGDLHPHVMDLVFITTIVTLLFIDIKTITPLKTNRFFLKYKIFTNGLSKKDKIKWLFKNKFFRDILIIKSFVFIAFSASFITNSWDLIAVAVFVAIKDLIFIARCRHFSLLDGKINLKKLFKYAFLISFSDLFFLILFVGLQLPYLSQISSPVKGIKINFFSKPDTIFKYFSDNFNLLNFFQIPAYNSDEWKMTWYYFERIVLVIVLIILLYKLIIKLKKQKISLKKFIFYFITFYIGTVLIDSVLGTSLKVFEKYFDYSPVYQFFNFWMIYILLMGIYFFIFLYKKKRNILKNYDYFILISFLTGIFLVVFCEFFYVADFFDRTEFFHHRTNTVFKLYYLAEVLFTVGSAYSLYELINLYKWQRKFENKNVIRYSFFLSLFRAFFILLIIISILYIPYATAQKISSRPDSVHFSLDSYNLTKEKFPDLIEATEYFKNIKNNNDVILETYSESYQMESVYSVFTTTPTVMGWMMHEIQWRETGNPKVINNILLDRKDDITNLYKLSDGWEKIVKKYGITYIWYGDAERKVIDKNGEEKFKNNKCFINVHSNKLISIYKINNDCIDKAS